MGFKILPWETGDEDRFDIFAITSDDKWTPRRFRHDPDDDDGVGVMSAASIADPPPIQSKNNPRPTVTPGILKESSVFLDPALPPFVPVTPMDPYSGISLPRLPSFSQGIDTEIPYYPMKGKMDHSSVAYPSEHSPPEQTAHVKVPKTVKKTEPVQNVVPKVKGIPKIQDQYVAQPDTRTKPLGSLPFH